MTIINLEGDGLISQLIAMFRAVAHSGKINCDELIRICYPGTTTDSSVTTRLRGVLSRWTEFGLFVEENSEISLSKQFAKPRGMTIDSFTEKLPSFCRYLILQPHNCLPLWDESGSRSEEGIGRTADFVRGISWALTQDIYSLPTSSPKQIETVAVDQTIGSKYIFLNDSRWNGLKYWSRYLGFATGDGNSFQIDPTQAIKESLPTVFGSKTELLATDFLNALSALLPVLDFGAYRLELESNLGQSRWRKPAENHLSMSLSFALRRLDFNKTIKLQGRADTGSSYRMTGRNFKPWVGFESVILSGGKR